MPPTEPVSNLVAVLVAGGLATSALVWLNMLWCWRSGQPVLTQSVRSHHARPVWSVAVANGWIGFLLLNRVAAEITVDKAPPQAAHVWWNLAISAGIFTVLAILLFGHRQFRPSDAGMPIRRDTVPLGLGTFLASVLPTFIALLVMSPFRSRETQHQLLQLLGHSPDAVTLFGLAVTVVVIAPLAEELLFRVTLQGWLTERIGSAVAVPIIAVLFAFIHGWRDGLALIPLALLLGYVYDRRQDYFAVVIAHGAFNGANLLLALLSLRGP